MAGQPANDEMIAGFMDGYDLTCPEPSANRSHSYRHGFMAGRSDKDPNYRAPWSNFAQAVQMADEAMALDDDLMQVRR